MGQTDKWSEIFLLDKLSGLFRVLGEVCLSSITPCSNKKVECKQKQPIEKQDCSYQGEAPNVPTAF